nr:CotH kinase family protein [Mycolicibacterium malmesburyense]CRL76196.1 CotH protein [Mycolicibacterium malmesburyense]
MTTANSTAPAPKRRLAHRVPVPVRQHWKLVAVLVAVVLGLIAALGQTSIRPYITGEVRFIKSEITDNIVGEVDLFDDSVSHSLTIDITDAEYRQMIEAFQKDGEKKWVTADITIDGALINDAAVRLKGNSTLGGLRGHHAGPGGGGGPDGKGPMGAPPEGMALPGGMASASAEDPTSLPLLISFDENADGRGYQGLTELSVRPGSPVLNEAMALSLTAATGQPTQRYTYATYTIAGDTATRLLLEHPDDMYANSLFVSDGYLYKADANSRLTYAGDDQSAYADQFKQINATDDGNLQPIINFVKWIDGADQQEFDTHLSDWVDTAALAEYLATQNLLGNADDMGGPGQNYYLWYDLDTEKFTVVSWDLNLAMNGGADTQPGTEVEMGLPGGDKLRMEPPPGAGGDRPNIENPLKTRFLASESLMRQYHDVYWRLYDEMYGDDHAYALLDDIVSRVPVTDGLTQQSLDDAANTMRTFISERIATLNAARSG